MNDLSLGLLDLLSQQACQQLASVDWLAEVDSTQSFLKRRIQQPSQSAKRGKLVCCADLQMQGRGQRNQMWLSEPEQNLLMSLAWPVQDKVRWLGVTLAAAVEVARVLSGYTASIQLKWPNDIICHDAKLGGLLLESVSDQQGLTWLILGIGLNINQAPLLEKQSTIALQDVVNGSLNRQVMAASLLSAWLELVNAYPQKGFLDWLSAWQAFDYLQGNVVQIVQGTQLYEGCASGINHLGHLIIKQSSGETLSFASGSVIKI